MSQELPNVDLLRELEPVAEKLINRHMSMFKEWNPHDYIPWSDGKNYYADTESLVEALGTVHDDLSTDRRTAAAKAGSSLTIRALIRFEASIDSASPMLVAGAVPIGGLLMISATRWR